MASANQYSTIPGNGRHREQTGDHPWLRKEEESVGDTLMAARSRPNDDWGKVGNGAKSRRKARRWWLWYV